MPPKPISRPSQLSRLTLASGGDVSTINVYFDIGRDPDLAAVDVQNRVNQVLGRLPADVRTTGVTVTKQSAGFLGGLGFFSRDNRYTAQFISNYLDLFVRDAIKRVPGVGNVIIFGERKYAMRLWLDPARRLPGHHGRRRVSALREQTCRGGGARRRAATPTRCTRSASARLCRSPSPCIANLVVRRAPTALCAGSDVGRRSWAPRPTPTCLRRLEASGMGVQSCLPPTRWRSTRAYEGDGRWRRASRGLEWRLLSTT